MLNIIENYKVLFKSFLRNEFVGPDVPTNEVEANKPKDEIISRYELDGDIVKVLEDEVTTEVDKQEIVKIQKKINGENKEVDKIKNQGIEDIYSECKNGCQCLKEDFLNGSFDYYQQNEIYDGFGFNELKKDTDEKTSKKVIVTSNSENLITRGIKKEKVKAEETAKLVDLTATKGEAKTRSIKKEKPNQQKNFVAPILDKKPIVETIQQAEKTIKEKKVEPEPEPEIEVVKAEKQTNSSSRKKIKISKRAPVKPVEVKQEVKQEVKTEKGVILSEGGVEPTNMAEAQAMRKGQEAKNKVEAESKIKDAILINAINEIKKPHAYKEVVSTLGKGKDKKNIILRKNSYGTIDEEGMPTSKVENYSVQLGDITEKIALNELNKVNLEKAIKLIKEDYAFSIGEKISEKISKLPQEKTENKNEIETLESTNMAESEAIEHAKQEKKKEEEQKQEEEYQELLDEILGN